MGTRELLTEEHFVSIPGFPNYEVSNFGRVCNVTRGYDLSQRVDDNGFCNVALYHNGKRKDFGVHRLVAQAFFTDYSRDVEVEHINQNREDNTVRNLTLGRKIRIRIKVDQFDKEFDSIQACAEALGISHARISEFINNKGTRTDYRGYTFTVIDRAVN